MKAEDLYLRIRAIAHSIDVLLSYGERSATESEDIDILAQMLVALIDDYDKQRA